jgi:hypothetical protein
MLVTHRVGTPRGHSPKKLHYLGEVTTHYLKSSETIMYYSDQLNNDEDKAELERHKVKAAEYNKRDIPIWM